MDKKNPNLMKIIKFDKILKVDSSKDYSKLRKEVENEFNIDEKKYSILCLDMKYKFIIDGDDSFNQWKNNRKNLGNIFLILEKQKIGVNENIDNLYKRIQFYNMYENLDNLQNQLNLKIQDIKSFEEMRNKLNKEVNEQMQTNAKLNNKVIELEKKKEEIEKIIENNQIKLKEINDETKKNSKENNDMTKNIKKLNKIINSNLEMMKKFENLYKTKEERENNIKEIKNKFEETIKLIIKSYEDRIDEIKINLDKKFKKYINQLKEEEKETKKILLSMYEDKTKEVNEFFISTQIFHGTKCNECNKEIQGIKYECSECDYNLCESCELINFLEKKHLHKFYKIRKPMIKQSIINEKEKI